MAKHPHRLILQHKKTWRCTLGNCSFFVHIGLSHILVGKEGRCWECNEVFTIDEVSLRDEMPLCYDCRALRENMPTSDAINTQVTLAKEGVEKVEELTELQRTMLEMLGKLPKDKK